MFFFSLKVYFLLCCGGKRRCLIEQKRKPDGVQDDPGAAVSHAGVYRTLGYIAAENVGPLSARASQAADRERPQECDTLRRHRYTKLPLGIA